jgi:aquaporin Z
MFAPFSRDRAGLGMIMFRKLAAEAFGTFWLVFAGIGSALISAGIPELGIGFLGVALALGLTVMTMAYAVGRISGGHFNPAVSFGLALGGRLPWSDLVPYWVAQLVGGIAGAAVLYLVATGNPDFLVGNFASNGYGELSPGGYSLTSGLVVEVIGTAFFVIVILGTTHRLAPVGFAPIAIGLALTLIHLFAIPVTNASVNPARSIATAIFSQQGALGQVWLFIVAPLLGGALGAVIWRYLLCEPETEQVD